MGRQQRPRPAAGGPAVAEGKSHGDTGPGHWAGRRRRQADSMGGGLVRRQLRQMRQGVRLGCVVAGALTMPSSEQERKKKKERKKLSRAASA